MKRRTYTVSSDPTSAQEVDLFAVEVVEPVSALKGAVRLGGLALSGAPGTRVERGRGRGSRSGDG